MPGYNGTLMSDQVWVRYQCFWILKNWFFNCDYTLQSDLGISTIRKTQNNFKP